MMIRLATRESGHAVGEWQRFVWACNDIEAKFFGAPSAQGDWWAGGQYETYAHAYYQGQEGQ